jgi:uncharacterized protein (UPF0332 family)
VSVEGFLAKAESRLVAAARDLDAGDVERSIGASYYAMLYAAEALLERHGIARSKHSGVIAAFGEHFVKTGKLDPAHHANLVGAFALRSAADYDTNAVLSPDAGQETLDGARALVAACRLLIA